MKTSCNIEGTFNEICPLLIFHASFPWRHRDPSAIHARSIVKDRDDGSGVLQKCLFFAYEDQFSAREKTSERNFSSFKIMIKESA